MVLNFRKHRMRHKTYNSIQNEYQVLALRLITEEEFPLYTNSTTEKPIALAPAIMIRSAVARIFA
jgi:hypothetical protein